MWWRLWAPSLPTHRPRRGRDLSKVTIRGLLTKSETGFWMGGVPPHGYDLRYEGYSGDYGLPLIVLFPAILAFARFG